jgi:hypothetical protein
MLGWISWRALEPTEGDFAWTHGTGNDVDNIMRAGQSANLKVLARLQDVPAWATSDGTGRLAAARPEALRNFTQALATHAAGRIDGYEVFNEPNLNYEWGEDLTENGPRAMSGFWKLPMRVPRPATPMPPWSRRVWPMAPAA